MKFVSVYNCVFCCALTTAVHNKLGPICPKCLGMYEAELIKAQNQPIDIQAQQKKQELDSLEDLRKWLESQ